MISTPGFKIKVRVTTDITYNMLELVTFSRAPTIPSYLGVSFLVALTMIGMKAAGMIKMLYIRKRMAS